MTDPSQLTTTNWSTVTNDHWSRHKVILSQSEVLGKVALGIVKYLYDRPSQPIEVCHFGSQSVYCDQLSWTVNDCLQNKYRNS